jgi:hypothetical protein|tara:strand:+ start:81 stop:812 length:732 start_codon:yes stop_codon:yes gene_type:complete
MTNEDKTLTKLDKAIAIKNEQMKEGVHYGKVVDNQSDFLYLTGASLLADLFGIDAVMDKCSEESVGGQAQITVTMNMFQNDKLICTGVGTWDTGEMLGNMKGARQRGIAMAYKRAYVMGVRYATSTHGLFSQDKDVVDSTDVVQGSSVPRQQTQASVAVDDDTGEKLTVPPEMVFDEMRKELVFAPKSFGVKAVGKSINEIMEDNKGFLEWMLNLGKNPSKPDERVISDELRNLIVQTLQGAM